MNARSTPQLPDTGGRTYGTLPHDAWGPLVTFVCVDATVHCGQGAHLAGMPSCR